MRIFALFFFYFLLIGILCFGEGRIVPDYSTFNNDRNDPSWIYEKQGNDYVNIITHSTVGGNDNISWAHDKEAFEGEEDEDKPSSVQGRLHRVWKIQEKGEVGDVDVIFDLSSFDKTSAFDLRLIVDVDGDGKFKDESQKTGGVISHAQDLGGQIFKFEGISVLDHNVKFTLGSTNKF